MEAVPEISYALSGEVHIAYQSFGNGPGLIGVPPFVQNIEAMWQDPSGLIPRFLNGLGAFVTVTHFDKRGTGLSDAAPGFVGVEERIDDLRAVMDAAGIERASIGGISEGGPLSILFAATYPDRVDKLLLINTSARFVQGESYPHGPPRERFERLTEQVVARWATANSLLVSLWMPSMVQDIDFCRWITGYERASASPGAVRDIMRFIGAIDVTGALSVIQAPTLVLHRSGDALVPIDHGRYLASNIPGARLLEIPGVDHVPWVPDPVPFLEEIEEFLTGERSGHVDTSRVLATVLFTDIVKSTERATTLGDQRWLALLDRHDACVRRELARYGGVEVDNAGDGFLSTFDSPSRAVRAGLAICRAAREIGMEVRAGLHTGEVEHRSGRSVGGLAVHVGARVAALAGPSEVLASSTVRDLVLGSEFTFEDRGAHVLKGLDGEWRLLAVRD
ncbi:MAG: adenylate/guanylate cyclase domain-containing protein [Acidimicrobiales bacterium]